MKKCCLILTCILLMFLLCGCTNRQNNCFVEGVFTSDDYKLIVTAIDEETFKSKNGINAVEDKSVNRKNQYYEVVLYRLGSENESDVELTFTHLTLSTVTVAEPCFYTDSDGNGLGPSTVQNRTVYGIIYNGEELTLEE